MKLRPLNGETAFVAGARPSKGASTAPSEPPRGTGCAGRAGARPRILRRAASSGVGHGFELEIVDELTAGGIEAMTLHTPVNPALPIMADGSHAGHHRVERLR